MRNTMIINDSWRFFHTEAAGTEPAWMPDGAESVTLPHVWNKENAAETGCTAYQRSFSWHKAGGKRLFLDFGAVSGVCRVWLNGCFLGEHRGGYARFRFDASEAVREGENRLTVTADNTRYEDINPLTGDFNNYGGIYRDVSLIETESAHFDLLRWGDQGVTVKAAPDGTVSVSAALAGRIEGCSVSFRVLDGECCAAECTADARTPEADLQVEKPHLWNGRQDPHLYTLCARLLRGEELLDEVRLRFGFRKIEMTADRGLFLNGQHLRINGVAKHQDFEGMGCAPTREQLREDLALILESGANSVRLSHYQHPDFFYDLCDEAGLLVWAEIPMLSMPDGNDGVVENAAQQLRELIAQCRHHPCIYCWGVQNEIAMVGESLEMYRKTEELARLVPALDDTRLSACANLYNVKNNSQLNFMTDMVGYNQYFGWYNGEMQDYGPFLDAFHRDNPQVPLGISEYGVDCSVNFHSAQPKTKDYTEDFQALFHETVYPQLTAREWLWGSYVWNMFDFGSAIRNEGGTKGKNCKGLVTFDRKIKKDAFYFYKAQWSEEPFVYVAGRRFKKRCGETTAVKIYSNLPEVTLTVNGSSIGAIKAEHVFIFENVALNFGENTVTAASGAFSDTVTLERVAEPEKSYIFVDPNPEVNVKNWFTMGQSQDDLFPPDRYSIMDTISALMESPDAWAIVPQKIRDDPRNAGGSPMTLLRIFQWMKAEFNEDFIKDVNKRLNQVRKG